MAEHTGTIGGDIRAVFRNWRALAAGGLAHVICDGFTDMLYVFFPLWQVQFELSFTAVGFLKLMFSGTLACFQVPAGLLAERAGGARLLIAGSLLTAGSVLLLSQAPTAVWLGLLLAAGGLGASAQHPVASSLVADLYGEKDVRRAALSLYNLSGDIGKLVFPALAALLVSWAGWRTASSLLGLAGLAVTAGLWLLARRLTAVKAAAARPATGGAVWLGRGEGAFVALVGIGVLDSATRMGFLTFFPFLLLAKGADMVLVGLALSLVFAGGIMGKFVCGVVATRLGALRTVVLSETATAACIGGMLVLPLAAALALAPLLGIVLNGTSSVLYGSVPELVAEERRNRAFALFYTATIGAGAVSPFVYGLASDGLGLAKTMAVVAAVVLATVPLTLPLRGKLAS